MYIALIVVAILLTIVASHYLSYTHIRLDTGIDIQQTEHPSPDVIYKMLSTKCPCLFMYEIEMWDGFDLLIGHPYETISTVLLDNKDLVKILKKEYLSPYNLALTRDWVVSVLKQHQTWEQLGDAKPTRQTNYNQLLANYTGLMMVCIIHPKHADFIAKYNTTTSTTTTNIPFSKYLETSTDIDYLCIPVRPGHVAYIPYGWYYYIYCGQSESYTAYMSLVNQTWFG
jgi:hypothetical protein